MGKAIKLDKNFKKFLSEIDIDGTFESKIIELIRLNNPEKYRDWLNFKNG